MNTKTCRSNFNVNLHYLFVHMLVYSKHLLFNMHGMNIKVNNPHNFTGGISICDIKNTEVLDICIMCVYVYTYINLK